MQKRIIGWMSVTLVLVVATAVMVTPAFAVDPQEENCKGLGTGVKKIDLKVVPNTAGSVSSFKGGALLCGSDLGPDPKGYKTGTVQMPWTTQVTWTKLKLTSGKDFWIPKKKNVSLIITRCANPSFYNTKGGVGKKSCPTENGPYSLKEGQYTGSVGMGISTGGAEIALDGALSKIYVQKAPGTPKGNASCTETAVACYQGTDGALGYADITVEKKDGTYKLKIGEIKLMVPLPVEVFYTRIGYPEDGKPMDLCAYAGTVNGDACGSAASDDWVQKNGPAAKTSCFPVLWVKMLMGYASMSTGIGFIVTTENNVPGANDVWSGGTFKYLTNCAPLTLVESGNSGAGSGAESSGSGAGQSGSGGSEKQSSQDRWGSSHSASSYRRFS